MTTTSVRIPFLFVLILSASIGPMRVAHADDSLRYSLPWQLRPVTIDDGARVDTAAAAFNDPQGNVDIAFSTMFAATYKATDHWAPLLRLGVASNNAPGAALDGSSFVNPVIGATYARRNRNYRLALTLATTLPIGTGGGDSADPRVARTNAAALTARPADQAMFEVNYLTESVGVAAAYVDRGFTAQVDATLQQGIRVRGSNSADSSDAVRTSAAVGVHVGAFIGSHVSLGADLRYQRWLSEPSMMAAVDSTTIAFGPRLHFRVGKEIRIHPGISVSRGIDARGFGAPLVTAQATTVQLDLPVTF